MVHMFIIVYVCSSSSFLWFSRRVCMKIRLKEILFQFGASRICSLFFKLCTLCKGGWSNWRNQEWRLPRNLPGIVTLDLHNEKIWKGRDAWLKQFLWTSPTFEMHGFTWPSGSRVSAYGALLEIPRSKVCIASDWDWSPVNHDWTPSNRILSYKYVYNCIYTTWWKYDTRYWILCYRIPLWFHV